MRDKHFPRRAGRLNPGGKVYGGTNTGVIGALGRSKVTDHSIPLMNADAHLEVAWEDKDTPEADNQACYDACIDKGESEDDCEQYCYADKSCDWADKEQWGDTEEWEDK